MKNIVIFGPPGSGKGTQSQKLKEKYNLLHVSTGDVLRDHIARETQYGKIAAQYISKGELIPDELMLEILGNHISGHLSKGGNVIFDGFPRTIPQADALKKFMKDMGTEIHSVVGLEVDDDELTQRLIQRGKDSGRSDDNPETIKNRLAVYHSTTQPLKEYYQKEGLYHGVKGVGGIDEIFNEICSHIDSAEK